MKPDLKDITNNLKESDTRKVRLTIAINSISSKDTDEECVTHSKSDKKHQWKVAISFFDCVNFLHCKCHKINLNHG